MHMSRTLLHMLRFFDCWWIEVQLWFLHAELLCGCLSGEKTQLRHSVWPT